MKYNCNVKVPEKKVITLNTRISILLNKGKELSLLGFGFIQLDS